MSTDSARGSVAELVEQIARSEESLQEGAFDRLMGLVPDLDAEGLEALVDALEHTEVVARQAASAALAAAGDLVAAVEEQIARALRDSDPIVRGNAALALGGLGGRAYASLEDLQEALGAEEDDWASAVIAKVIQDISPDA